MTDDHAERLAPSFAVNADTVADLEGRLGDVTTAELLTVVLARLSVFREAQQTTPAGREFSLAITHAEDARSRWNAGIYRMNGTYAPSDAQKQIVAAKEETPDA